MSRIESRAVAPASWMDKVATLHRRFKLFRGLWSGEWAYTGPFYAGIDLSNNCNLHCIGCSFHSRLPGASFYHDPAPGNMSCDLFEKICRELRAAGTRVLVLQGSGEPFLHPELSSIISIGKAYGFHLTLLTNGTLLDRERIQDLIDLRLDILKVTLWATTVEEFALNCPGTDPSAFLKILEGIRLLRSLRDERRIRFPFCSIHYPINRINYRSLEAVTDLAVSLNVDGVTFAPFHHGAGKDWNPYLMSPDEENLVSRALIGIRQRLNSHGLAHNIEDTLVCYRFKTSFRKEMPCYLPWIHVRIHIDGMCHLCSRCDVPFGSLQEQSFQEIWNGRPIRDLRRSFLRTDGVWADAKCQNCFFASDSWRIHKRFKLLLPLVTRRLRTNA
jgi:MoaA/NifB/PqqE/SkfB family radical SAM enzyme